MIVTENKRSDPSRPSGRAGFRLYAVGDVHGCYHELCAMLEKIRLDHFSRPESKCVIVFLGDLIDRGPHSRDVIRHLRDRPPDFATFHFIRGNHEEMVLRALDGEPELIPDWLTHGGYAFARSYGLHPDSLIGLDIENLERILINKIPAKDLEFLAQGHDSIRFGDYLLVHAGIRPGVALDAQSGRDLRWIRDEFLRSTRDFGVVVVHGHTISPGIVERGNRIGLDTGAYKRGVLSAVRLEGEERSYLSVGNRRVVNAYEDGEADSAI